MLQELKEYDKTTLGNEVLSEVDINKCFNVDNDFSITGQLTDAQIVDKSSILIKMMKIMVKKKMRMKKYQMQDASN